MFKIILINIRNSLILLAIIYFAIPIVTEVSSRLEARFPEPDNRAKLINYKDDPWAEQHFNEYHALKMQYVGYVEWQPKPVAGQTITIDPAQRIRVTPPIPGLSSSQIFFFGGSTMWGEGSRDDLTIPAQYQGFAREIAVNYGQLGWTAHQSLNQLMRLMEGGHKPTNVVFYDGFNEVLNKCLSESDFFSHSHEKQIREALEYKPTEFGYYWRTLKDAGKAVVEAVLGEKQDAGAVVPNVLGDSQDAQKAVVPDPLGAKQQNNKKLYDCDTDPQKANLVASALISDWKMAKYITDENGARFFAFLQPVAFLSKTRLSQVELKKRDAEINRQFQVIYPLIRAKMKESGIGTDLTEVLDRDDYIYIDTCHVSPNGNRLIAEAIWKVISAPGQSSVGKQ